ncbi:sugar ABC transporter substrate-binding protein [Nonomuraea aurantiaca]|uniref:sugar ABC transporter substrate-binding protein n=1 Tax=Nonomuraea aurantiaca TaxID=2878562 RepID=UPI001CD9F5CA|nr:sugar ABC transporter substrate-binding protein [Nonomuraea aurantiaca]MCA2230067.1 sugar ABC transporter substrate-binding protein [Nonomuraea aurantiaca]
MMAPHLRSASLALALALCLGACSTGSGTSTTGASPGTAEPLKVGFITKFPVDFYDTMVDAVKTWNRDHPDVEVLFGQGKSGTDDEGETAQIESMLTKGVKAIAITPTSPNLQNVLQKAVDAGVKVVLVDNDIPSWTGKSSVVATDNLAGGKLAGAWLAERLKPGSTIAVLQGRLGNPSLDDRVTGMLSTLGDGVTVAAKPATDCDQTKGLNAAQDILAAHPGIAAIYGACGPPILGALQAVKSAGNKPGELVLVGFDASPGELKAIAAGEVAASVAQFPAKMGSVGIETAVAAARDQRVAAIIDTGTEMVTKENVAGFQ